MHTFLDDLQFTPLDSELIDHLESDLTVQELNAALRNTHNNKAPGPDRFQVNFLKWFQAELISLLHSVYVESVTLFTSLLAKTGFYHCSLKEGQGS